MYKVSINEEFTLHVCMWTPFLCTGLTIGLQHTLYSVGEVDGSLEVCAEVLEGNILINETAYIDYITASSDAEGQYCAQTSAEQCALAVVSTYIAPSLSQCST